MIAESSPVVQLADGSSVKIVAQLLTTHRGVGATMEYSLSYFISADGKFWEHIGSMGELLVTPEQLYAAKMQVWEGVRPNAEE